MALLAKPETNPLRSSKEMADVKRAAKMCSPFAHFMEIGCLVFLIWSLNCMIITIVEALPFPAPNLHHCLASEECCTPVPTSKGPTKFEFQTHLPMRTRPAAQLVDDAYIAKYQRAVELMKALPDTDGRSFTNQWKVHCLYCDNHLYFDTPTHPYPLEIHKSWLFFPWHRLFVYFHERILAKLIDDDTFALPFWNWDNQSPEHPKGNVVPKLYADKHTFYKHPANKTSSLYDDTRTECALTPKGFVEFQLPFSCPGPQNATEIRAANAHLMFINLVGMAVTPLIFHGLPYRLGDQGGGGFGSMEFSPHGTVHLWVNLQKMLTFRDSASDPIFFGHHANVDRLWELWKTLPGGVRDEISDPDYLNTEFTFYDENGDIVTVSIAQALQLDQLRYKYQEVVNPWVENGAVRENSKPEWSKCNSKLSPEAIAELIEKTGPLQGPVNFTLGPLTFKVRRSLNRSAEDGEELLEVRANVDYTQGYSLTAFAFWPEAAASASVGCGEFLGSMGNLPHVGISQKLKPQLVWRIGIKRQLELMGWGHEQYIVVTLAGSPQNLTPLVMTGASVIYSKE